ncbi:MAG: 50S ribosomal protein L18 [Planctomycetota bacterium]|jgi:large subunit ribosomal protein L18
MDRNKRKRRLRERRHKRVRKNVAGTPECPRLCVFRSNKHIYAQVVDDLNQRTLASCSTLSREIRDQSAHGGSVESAGKVGELIGRKCVEQGISAVVFDRGGYRYHGRVKALAEAARGQFSESGAKGF